MDRSRQVTADKNLADGLKLLIIDDEPNHAEVVAESLERVGYQCVVAASGSAGAKMIEQDEPDVILTDLKMDGFDGLAILRKARQELPDTEVVVITGHGDVQTAVEAMKAGATNYLQKPVNLAELRAMVEKAAERFRLKRTNKELQQQLDEKFGFEGVVGNSARMHDVLKKLKSIAPTAATVLIQGETGTGKELVAKAIHNNSPRKNKNFVAMNCTALNENLLEDELFGHEPGSFTGADRMRKGRFEHANGGTLFLDEVGDMPLSLQAKLLRVLENQEVTAHRQQRSHQGQRAPPVGHQSRFGGRRGLGSVSPGPLFSPEGRDHQAGSLARTARGRPPLVCSLPQRIQSTARQESDRHRGSTAQDHGGL